MGDASPWREGLCIGMQNMDIICDSCFTILSWRSVLKTGSGKYNQSIGGAQLIYGLSQLMHTLWQSQRQSRVQFRNRFTTPEYTPTRWTSLLLLLVPRGQGRECDVIPRWQDLSNEIGTAYGKAALASRWTSMEFKSR